ncbi:hypothetical protein H112_06902 [Trichophyton rubrum D6]|uniref:Uncharacterized protein n=1 Tax=Trichophyton rubrum CBS 288.86 TaxID=1215330 RepID=A0A022VU11_TRIRU|nr:hypothetical protein H102_06887 [Trichophyton rubrum CBS 100081]EZF49526.1 hypothetical protein H103_06910 [Trichophyton rubrum CBS 288.86]EZF60153.1 hypothetical protein H104_06865 [Trichophyton rubrum CBS 289.86]EZF81485.1 hypothetical protein H110_06906 [Trichophyton rubrum MR1448]KDB30659.1 hypothetical protein H112_06902 [Trichophyton rubrum D6]
MGAPGWCSPRSNFARQNWTLEKLHQHVASEKLLSSRTTVEPAVNMVSCRLVLLIEWYTSISVKATIDIFGDLSVITHILRSNCKSISRGKYWALTLSYSNAIQDSGSAPCPETYAIYFSNDLHHLGEPSLKAALRKFLRQTTLDYHTDTMG